MESEIQKKIENKGMIISRMPEWCKDVIKEIATLEHSGDYGECIAQFVREANEYRLLKDKFFNNDLNVTLSYPKEGIESDSVKSITLANGKKLNIPGGKK